MMVSAKKSILVVDDEESIRGLLHEVLSDGYDVSIATNGREALEMLEKSGFDLMITDIVMPEQEGIETLLAATKKYDSLRVIAMSGVANKRQYLLAASFLGAKEILQKPFTIDEVRETVARVLQ